MNADMKQLECQAVGVGHCGTVCAVALLRLVQLFIRLLLNIHMALVEYSYGCVAEYSCGSFQVCSVVSEQLFGGQNAIITVAESYKRLQILKIFNYTISQLQ